MMDNRPDLEAIEARANKAAIESVLKAVKYAYGNGLMSGAQRENWIRLALITALTGTANEN